MSSVLMWEVMSLVCMRSVLSSAMGAMQSSMSGMAAQMVASSMAPAFGLGTLGGQQAAATTQLNSLVALLGGSSGTGAATPFQMTPQVSGLLAALQSAAQQQQQHLAQAQAQAQGQEGQAGQGAGGARHLGRAQTIHVTVGAGAGAGEHRAG
jgi:hypothetical protein